MQQQKLCECGCGKAAPIAMRTVRSAGYVKGQPMRFRRGHSVRKVRTPFDRAWAKVDVREPDECWPWTGYIMQGRPQIVVDGEDVSAVRIIYEAKVGSLAEGDKVRRKCKNSACCNPAHLTTETSYVEHGSLTMYRNYKCRCADCAEAGRRHQRQRVADNHARRVEVDGRMVAAHLPKRRHGKLSTYVTYGCRCPKCTKANCEHGRETASRDPELAKRRSKEYAERQKAERSERRVEIDGRMVAAHLPEEEHGAVKTYRHHYCRCAPCTDAATEYSRKYSSSKKRIEGEAA